MQKQIRVITRIIIITIFMLHSLDVTDLAATKKNNMKLCWLPLTIKSIYFLNVIVTYGYIQTSHLQKKLHAHTFDTWCVKEEGAPS